MGGHLSKHVVPYQKNGQRALDKLRLAAFERGEYDGAGDGAERPDDALDRASADGTRSILDIQFLSSTPELGCASELTVADRVRYFGTATPTVAQIEGSDAFWSAIGRGTARYVVIHDGGKPTKLFFAGCSLD